MRDSPRRAVRRAVGPAGRRVTTVRRVHGRPRNRVRPTDPTGILHIYLRIVDSVRPAHGGGHERRFYRKVYAARSVSIEHAFYRGGRPRPRRSSQNQARTAIGMDGTHNKLDARMTSTPMVAPIIDCRRTSSREHRAPAAQREPRTPRTDDSHTTEILATYRPLPRPSGFCHAGQLPRAAEGRPLTERALLSEASIFSVRMRPSLSNSGHPSSSSSLREPRSTQSSSPMRDPLMHSCERESVS